MQLQRYLVGMASLIGVATSILVSTVAFTAEEAVPLAAIERMGDSLAGRSVVREEDLAGAVQTRAGTSLRDLYRSVVRAVPLVVAPDGTGSAIVIHVDPADSSALVITNHHVVEKTFKNEQGTPFVLALFYDRQLAGEPFNSEQFVSCVKSQEKTPWCEALRRSLRTAWVLGTDPARDLALLKVINVPSDVKPIRDATIDTVEPGDDVAVVGHPKGLVWSLTQGIVSAVRTKFPMGSSQGTVIQTQTPIAPGNSGGPLLTLEGRLVGVITWQLRGEQGLNAAVAINEVQGFVSELAAKPRKP